MTASLMDEHYSWCATLQNLLNWTSLHDYFVIKYSDGKCCRRDSPCVTDSNCSNLMSLQLSQEKLACVYPVALPMHNSVPDVCMCASLLWHAKLNCADLLSSLSGDPIIITIHPKSSKDGRGPNKQTKKQHSQQSLSALCVCVCVLF